LEPLRTRKIVTFLLIANILVLSISVYINFSLGNLVMERFSATGYDYVLAAIIYDNITLNQMMQELIIINSTVRVAITGSIYIVEYNDTTYIGIANILEKFADTEVLKHLEELSKSEDCILAYAPAYPSNTTLTLGKVKICVYNEVNSAFSEVYAMLYTSQIEPILNNTIFIYPLYYFVETPLLAEVRDKRLIAIITLFDFYDNNLHKLVYEGTIYEYFDMLKEIVGSICECDIVAAVSPVMIAVENAYLYYSILQGAVLFYASMIMLVSSYMIVRLLDKSYSEVLLSRFYDSLGASLKGVFARERLPVLAASLVSAAAAYWVSRMAFRGGIVDLLGGLYLASVFLSVALLGLAMYRRFVVRARLSQAVLAPILVLFFLVVYYGSGTLVGHLGLFTYMFVVLLVVLLLIFAELGYSGVGGIAARLPVLGVVNVIPFLLAFMVVAGFVVYPLIGAASAARVVVDPGGVFPEYIHNVTFVSGGDGFGGHRDYYVVTSCTVLGVGDVDFVVNVTESMGVIYAEVPVVVVSESLAEGLGITGPTLFINERVASFLGLSEGVHRGVEVRVGRESFAADLRVVYGFSGLWTDTTTDPAVLHPLILLEHLKYYSSLVVVEGSAPVECCGSACAGQLPPARAWCEVVRGL